MDDALKAWSDDQYAKVAVLAPLAVEHLGKAVLWRQNPVLVVPLMESAEATLMILATKPELASPKLRTVGLMNLLRRLDQLLGGLPIDRARRIRMIDIRNGAMHVGTPTQSRHVLLDALALCGVFLARLGEDARAFYGDHHASVEQLLDAKRSEAGHRYTAKVARANRHLREIEERLGAEVFKETTNKLEEHAETDLDPADFGANLWGINATCPVCASAGRLFGAVDLEPDVDYDVEADGTGGYDSWAYVAGWTISFAPNAFACNVCRIDLTNPEELAEGGHPTGAYDIDQSDLGEDFDPDLYAQNTYGVDD